ncbi:MAG: hypothetical protein KatS3mg121_1436 [Gammaproteobacteria bacterium]|nr:MAG: hypothetical protein KatS3mg121_1436 [Gammaproteobacteria bacterium]
MQNILGENGRRRAVVVAVPADQPPLLRAHGALLATAVAEFFRDRGLQVLLLMDSLTRYAQALREIALAIGEPPATKGYPPSVFARLPQLVERAGPGGGEGAITAFYTVLTEGDDPNDPVADAARAVLDGHIVLSRQVAEGGRYPAIDVEASVSRLAAAVTDETHQQRVQRFRRLWARYNENRDLIRLGVYKPGSDAEIDEAIALYPRLSAYLAQHMRQAVGLEASIQELARIFQEHDRDASSGGRG